MCGMFLAAGNLALPADKFINNMFIMDSVRGEDSCGMITVPTFGNIVHTLKRAILPHDFIDLNKYDDLLLKRNEIIVGHNRRASKGKVNTANAHPFTIGHIIGVHNGTLLNQKLLPDHEKFDVDSENIIHSIDKDGVAETWSKIHGAAALIWVDLKADTLNLLRNSSREFYYCFNEANDQMFGASEELMLKLALKRNNIKHGKVKLLPTDTHFSITVDTTIGAKEVFTITKEKLTPYTPPVYKNNYSSRGWNNWQQDYPLPKKKADAKADAKALPSPKEDKGNINIDFFVRTKRDYAAYNYYLVEDNNNPGTTYIIEDYQKILTLKEGDFATADRSVVNHYPGHRLRVDTIKFDSMYEWYSADNTGEDEDTPIDAEFNLVVDKEDEGGETIGHDCSWCSSPIAKTEVYALVGHNTYLCESCKQEPMVQDYIEEDYLTTSTAAGSMI